ncbi:hypothetical protein ACTXN4_22460 [Pseudomonas helleri]|uniref:hypothetical protein n=2 Tax=Pseudomonas helleri TaxID=1608996 RepID=UPI0006546697|nr:hypothetical protein [Pseudomonas helleri]KMN21390.1 hypothetical protein TU85_19695 [Pseudomonas helleri]MQU60478.1 hypothetical protein [Pseudomonas helleri]
MPVFSHLPPALLMIFFIATAATAQAAEPASTYKSSLSETPAKRLPGKGPYIYTGCITPFSGHWVAVLPFRSIYATAEELMANRPDLRECVKA